jgi:hypothetical protein
MEISHVNARHARTSDIPSIDDSCFAVQLKRTAVPM